jgi:hypothetical protein
LRTGGASVPAPAISEMTAGRDNPELQATQDDVRAADDVRRALQLVKGRPVGLEPYAATTYTVPWPGSNDISLTPYGSAVSSISMIVF